jgi:hypothetical protein
MMYQTVNQCRCQAVIPKNSIPARKFQIGSDNETLPFIAFRNHLKYQLCSIFVERNARALKET